jgi:hypothetical protein
MSLLLDLPIDLENELAAEARRLGISVSDYALRVLAAWRTPNDMPSNGAELLTYWHKLGVIGMREDITDAPQHARVIRQQAEFRERA